jgi:phosphatidylethanolamine-binding protein (PEBP) family uncharacterized protein
MLEKLPAGVGHALQSRRAGLEATVSHRLRNVSPLARIEVHSSAFETGQSIPVQYTADGAGLSPPLEWKGIPDTAARLVIVVEDADSPTPHPLVHAIVVHNDLQRCSLAEGALKSPDHRGVGMQTGRNSYLSQAWLPPDPPPGHGPHRYIFQVFALRGGSFSEAPGRHEVFRAIEEDGLAAGYCIGTYERRG